MFSGIQATLQAISQGIVSIEVPLALVALGIILCLAACHIMHTRSIIVSFLCIMLLFGLANIVNAIPAG